MADLHVARVGGGRFAKVLAEISDRADILVLAGDLTDTGHVEEARALAEDLRSCRIRKLAVLGNHDFDSGETDAVRQIIEEAGTTVLDGNHCSLDGVGFAGVKGFGGGFGNRMLASFGEEAIKRFVEEAEAEAKKLEHALSQLQGEKKVVLLHYSPVRDTVMGEEPEVFPFLGSSRLEHVIDDYQATLVVHGHAHHGAAEGRTSKGVPVYNVAAPLLAGLTPGQPYRLFEL